MNRIKSYTTYKMARSRNLSSMKYDKSVKYLSSMKYDKSVKLPFQRPFNMPSMGALYDQIF